jgi:hypothetical protein
VWRATAGPVGLTAAAGTDTVEAVVAQPLDCAFLKFRDAEGKTADQPLQFAEPHAVDLRVDAKAKWTAMPEDNLLWRKRFVVPGALGVNIGMKNVVLPPGAKVFVYSEESGDVFGPYTSAHNRPHRELWTPVVPGENVVLEILLPSEAKRDFSLYVAVVNGAYRDFYKLLAEKQQGSCNIDVVCAEGDPWRREIRSVGVYSVSGTFLCSGTMVMNERRDFRNYFLTANHCGVSSRNAASMVVYWNFESPTCGQLGGGSLAQYTAGATFRASYSASDFCLVELNQSPDPAFGVYYAGWERGGIAPANSVCIHHPDCEEKAISFVNTALRSTAYLSNTESASANHWRVVAWNLGTTEPGSSGSGLWNAATRRLVGQLHGGYASCTATTSSDWYGKISSSWTGGGLSSSRLSDWLDPDGSGITGMDGGDPTGDDNYENNDSMATAYDFSTEQTWLSSVAGLGVQLDEDWYKILVWPAGNERVQIDCRFQHAAGDIDIGLYDATSKLLAYSYGIWDNEFIEYTVPTAGVYYVKVFYSNQGNTYDLWWDDMPPLAEPMPDLVVKSMAISPTNPTPGTTVSFTVTVSNQGAVAASPSFSLGFWSARTSAPEIGTTAEKSASLGTIAAGAVSTVVFTATAPTAGTYTAWAYADRDSSAVAESVETNNAGPMPSGFSWTVTAGATAFPNGIPPNVPGRIEMEKFDNGGQGVAYRDIYGTVNGSTYRPGELVDLAKATTAKNGWYVRDTVAGEWLNYTVNATAAGSYKLAVRYKSAKAGGTFHIECDGVAVTASTAVRATSGYWANLVFTGVSLSTGTHQIRVVMDKNGLGGTVAFFDCVTFSRY